jgi:hypothetical protein
VNKYCCSPDETALQKPTVHDPSAHTYPHGGVESIGAREQVLPFATRSTAQNPDSPAPPTNQELPTH